MREKIKPVRDPWGVSFLICPIDKVIIMQNPPVKYSERRHESCPCCGRTFDWSDWEDIFKLKENYKTDTITEISLKTLNLTAVLDALRKRKTILNEMLDSMSSPLPYSTIVTDSTKRYEISARIDELNKVLNLLEGVNDYDT